MRLPRDVPGRTLARLLGAYGYGVTRQTGSHLRLTTTVRDQYHLTIPDHDAPRVGTLAAILGEVADHFGVERSDVARRLFEE